MSSISRQPNFPKLNDSNYSIWKHNMQAHLLVKSLWGITSGDETQPSDADSSAARSIYLMPEPDIQVMVAQHLMDAAVMWKKLKEMYEQVNPAAHFNAYAEFFNIHKKDDESLTNLVSRVEQALYKIRSTRSPTLTVEQLELELSCACLCNALPKEYESFRSAVLLLSDFTWSTLKEAFAQEQQNRQEHVQITQAMLASDPSTFSSSRSVICTFCNVSGHTEDKCFRKERAARQAKADAQNAASRRGKGRKGQKAHVAQEEESMQVLLTTPIPIHPSSQMQELTGSLIQVPLAT